MKLTKLQLLYPLFAFICYITFSSNSSGKMGVYATGCGTSGCHGSSSTNTSISMSFDGNTTLSSYVPGQKYAIILSIDNSFLIGVSTAKAGFDLNFSAGTLSNTPTGTMLMTRELHHTTPKAMTSGGATFAFDWTAPAAGAGTVTINIAGNGVNGTGDATGDEWNLKTITLTEFIPPKKANISSVNSSAITTTGATISAQINANGEATTAEVQFGLTTAYGSTKAMTPSSITGTTNTAATASLTGLTPNTTYNYRIKATNTAGDSLSANSTFKTNSAGAAVISSQLSTLSIFPNPAADYAILEGPQLEQSKELSVFTITGKKINLPYTYLEPQKVKLHTSNLSKGMYYVKIGNSSYSLVIEN